MANNLTFDNFSFKNKSRCELDFKQSLSDWNLFELFNRTDNEWFELEEEIKALKPRVIEIDVDTESNRQAIINEACDVIIMLDLLIQRLGGQTSTCIADKFNRTSDQIGSQIKIPV